MASNPLFEIGSELADFMRPGTLSRRSNQSKALCPHALSPHAQYKLW